MLIKQGVDISRLNREIRRGLAIVDGIFAKNGQELIITSTYEGNHGGGSLHYGNDAFDFRFSIKIGRTIVVSVHRALGQNYDVVIKTDHVHIEYDPKGSYKKR